MYFMVSVVLVVLLAIEVGTPVSRPPLADPGVRNYRSGLVRKARTRNQCRQRVPEPVSIASREFDT